MRTFTHWVIATSASPLGIVILAALDTTIFFSVPFGIDAAVMILAARGKVMTLIVPLLAIAGGTAGAALTYWMGAKIGEKGLGRYIPPRRLARVRRKIETSGAIALAALDLIPPPFPFTPFVLAAGALEVRRSTFFVTLALVRALRFGTEAYFAARFGRELRLWFESDLFDDIIAAVILLAIVLTAMSMIGVMRSWRRSSAHAAA
jgi:membrane protein YqaA with SNARE-associated domain